MYRTFKFFLLVVVFLFAIPLTQWAQTIRNGFIEIELSQITNSDYRYCLFSSIAQDNNISYIIDDENSSVLLASADSWADDQFLSYYEELKASTEREFEAFLVADKESQGASFVNWKSSLPRDLFALLFRQIMTENPSNRSGNQTCSTADPFCTTDVVSFHVDSNVSGVCEDGPDYGCMSNYTDRPPFWYYMKIGIGGTFTIRITNSNNLDLDFCAWGPFTNESTPCTSQLTANKIIDCDSPYNSVQECTIPSSSQVGDYYLLVITKYSTGSTDITFQKKANSGPGETDCGILPGFASNDGPYCVGETINLSINAQEGASYSWTGPGGFSSSQRTPSRPNCTMAMAGTYTCTVTVGTQTTTASTTVVVHPQPTANFTATTVCQGSATQFTNTSTTNPSGQNISGYQWNFGDGGTSTQQNPSHQYASAGTYTVTLTVNCNGTCTDTKTQTVTVLSQPTCNFNYTTVCQGTPTQFTSTATGDGITSYQWNFGDGQNGSGATASHTYAQPGTYTVTHTVATGNGDCTDSMTQTVTVLSQPVCSFTHTTVCAGSGTDFSSTAMGDGIIFYEWIFGDGLTGTGPNITHVYSQPGTYEVTHHVAIANNACYDEMTQTITVLPLPTCDFSFNTVCAGTATNFSSTATGGDITSYEWIFGDGHSGTGQNVSHTYTQSGTYQVTHIVSTNNGLCEAQQTQTVTVNAMPEANAGPDQTISYGSTAQLSGSAGSGTYSFHWEPANMVINPNAQNTQTTVLTNTQTFTLTVTNPQSQECVDTDQVTIHINGSSMAVTAGPNISICQGGSGMIQVNAGGGTGNFNYSWSPTTGLSNSHIYNPTASPTQTTTYTCTVNDGQTTQTASVTVTVNDVIIEHEEAFICPDDSYSWHGNTYYNPGTFEFNTTTPEGCEETIYLHLDYYPTYDETTINASICEGESYEFYGTTYTSSIQTSYTDHSVLHGCDSIVRLNLTVWPENELTIKPISMCPEQLPYTFYGVDYYENVDVSYLDTDIHGCDSVVRLILTVSDYYKPDTMVAHVCTLPYIWEIKDANNTLITTKTIEAAGVYSDTLPTAACQGIFSLKLNYQPKPEVEHFYVEECNSYFWPINGQTYTETGTYQHSVSMFPYPCEQEYYLHLTVNHQSISNDLVVDGANDPVCDEYLWLYGWNGETYPYYNDTVVTKTIPTAQGCDSVTTLTIRNMRYTPKPEIRCSDQNVEFPHQPITATEFNVNRYTYFASDQRTDATWVNSECQWSISKPSWRITPSDDNRSCTVFAMDWTQDTIWLTFKAVNSCSENGVLAKYWLKPSFYGIEEQEAYPASVEVVPNPNKGQMQLRFENMSGHLNIKVYSMNGSLVDEFDVNVLQAGDTYDYSMRRLQNGIYYFAISDGKRSVTKKVVVIH